MFVIVYDLVLIVVPRSVDVCLTLQVEQHCEETARLHGLHVTATLQIEIRIVLAALAEKQLGNLIGLVQPYLARSWRRVVKLVKRRFHRILNTADQNVVEFSQVPLYPLLQTKPVVINNDT